MGSSEGPHLHFEFRDSKTEKVINPLLFGFDKHIKDTKKSQSFQQYMFIDDKTTVNQSKRPLLLNLSLQKMEHICLTKFWLMVK
jgi:murein DD-endopeptidase MepM/ murein hydrolase activator NlpD